MKIKIITALILSSFFLSGCGSSNSNDSSSSSNNNKNNDTTTEVVEPTRGVEYNTLKDCTVKDEGHYSIYTGNFVVENSTYFKGDLEVDVEQCFPKEIEYGTFEECTTQREGYYHSISGLLVSDHTDYFREGKKVDAEQCAHVFSFCETNKEEFNQFITEEYCRNESLGIMNVSSAYVAGATGEGITVAVWDTGVDFTHPELEHSYKEEEIDLLYGFEGESMANEDYDMWYHGTAVAGIIAANKDSDQDTEYSEFDQYDQENIVGMQGVAYNAKIISTKVLGGMFTREIDATEYSLEKNADIVNISYGSTGYYESVDYPAFLDLMRAGIVVVAGAGNESSDCSNLTEENNNTCFFPAVLPFAEGKEEMLTSEGGWIVAGALKIDTMELASYSNKAGLTKSHYVVTPVDFSISANLGGDYRHFSGTSAATPYVSGVVALLKEGFPNLSGNQITQVIFDSCTDLGEEGVDDVYGHGLVNVKKAFELAETL